MVVRGELGDDSYPPAATHALRHDINALRDEFGCVITYWRGSYHLDDLGELHLLDLSEAELEALNILQGLTSDLPALIRPTLETILERLRLLLPPARRSQLTTPFRALRIEGPRPSTEPALTELIASLRRALGRQQIEFSYIARSSTAAKRHRVAPYELIVRDGHAYLDADALWSDGVDFRPRRILYRLERILLHTIRLLPATLPPTRLTQPRYLLRYTLDPEIARRRDIAFYFENSSVEYHEDGTATITAEISDLWYAHKVLLRYEGLCYVQEPPEIVEMLRVSARRFFEKYWHTPAT